MITPILQFPLSQIFDKVLEKTEAHICHIFISIIFIPGSAKSLHHVRRQLAALNCDTEVQELFIPHNFKHIHCKVN